MLEISTRNQVNHWIFLNVNKPLLVTLIEQFFFYGKRVVVEVVEVYLTYLFKSEFMKLKEKVVYV